MALSSFLESDSDDDDSNEYIMADYFIHEQETLMNNVYFYIFFHEASQLMSDHNETLGQKCSRRSAKQMRKEIV
jgi:hypothetical protein